jgi:multidrug efflux pump subunit AcrA (membrane-fusion protein)
MSPEEREAMRARFRAGGGPGGGSGARQRQPDGPVTRTVYVPDKTSSKPGKPMVKPVTIKTGIADGSFTEVLDGLNEGDEIATGVLNPALAASTPAPQQGRSPFGGGGFGGGRR